MTAIKRVVVRYRVKPECLEEHEALVRNVFAALEQRQPDGLAYQALKLEDGLTFVHVATVSTADEKNPLNDLTQFKAFTADIGERCDEKPVASTVTAIGAYRSGDSPA